MSTAVRTQAQAAPTRSFTPAPKVVLQPKCTCGGEPGPTGKCPPCDEHEQRKLQRFAAGPSAPSAVPPIVHDVLQSPGQPLDAGTRSFMEPRFGHDFSQVRVHTDGHAAESARAVNALAYTVGRDIAFDHGQYRPYTHSGKQLLAHELAHTIQQGGVQRYAKDVQMGVAADTRLERDAEAAARAVTAQADGLAPPALPIATRVFHPTIARAPAGPEDPNEEVREWEPAPSELKAIGVTAQSKHTPGVVSGIRAFRIKELPLPPEKGDVLEAWKARAAVGGLEAIVDVEGNPSAALKQERPATDTLRSIWLTKVGWDKKKAAENWKAAGGDSANFDPPKAGGGVCEMDHIVELQFLGSNAKENIQALDKSENASSGATIRGFLAGKASEIRNKVSGLKQVILHFDNVTQTSAICKACCKVEQAALAGSKGQAAAAADVEPYPVSAGGTATNLLVPKGTSQKKQTATIDIYESTIPQNRSAATLIPGLLLSTLNRKPPGSDIIEAKIDTRSKTALPITITDKKDKVPLRVAEGTGELKLVDPKPHMKFTYPYLSAGAITKLSYDPAGLSGEGTLTPSIPLLKDMQFGVAFSPNDFRITAGLDPQKIKPPIPGAKVKKAELAIVLVPEFNPSGTIEFEFAPGGKKLLDASLVVQRDSSGFAALGKMHAYLPGVDQAEGEVNYRGGHWTGGVTVESSRIKLPYVKSGTVIVAFSERGIEPSGRVVLEVPGGHVAEVNLERSGSRWIFKGKGEFKIPRLEPVTVFVTYDGEHLSATGKTGFVFHGLRGSLDVAYHDGKVSGKGEVDVHKGRAKGKLLVKMSPLQKFSGEGTITYQISESLIATAGIIIDESEKVTLKGALEFAKPIKLFEGVKGEKEIFKAGITIPIPGVSIGPVGLVIKIDGALGARYGIGPGELRNAKIAAAFNPLEDKPDLDVQMGALLYIPAYAGIYGSIRGAIAIDAKIASVSGGLTVTASASLDGKVAAEVQIHYQKSRFALDATALIDAVLLLLLKLDADVTAQAGIGPFSVETKKVWGLAAYKYDTGLRFGMKAPLHYASDEAFKPPSLDQIQWVTPDIKVSEMLTKLLHGSGGKETSG